MISRPMWREGGGPDGAMLSACLEEHLRGLPRLTRLKRYYDGGTDIARRRREPGLPNNRLAHGYPRFITSMAAGYLLGSPVAYEAEGDCPGLEALTAAYRVADIDSVDAELARNASIYGRAVELVYADEAARPRSVSLDPACAFVVYDDTVAARPMLGVYYAKARDARGEQHGWWVHVFTDAEQRSYRTERLTDLGEPVKVTPHWFGQVPMVEYWNDECERGDFEPVMGLIDAYDALQSDRMNDKQQFVDALLLLTGCTLETDERGRSPGQQLREDKALALPDSDARAEFLCKQLNEADTEVLRQALKEDIHKLCLVPDLTDREFAGNSSGVAMRYKLMGLEQLTRIKERWFREGLRERMRLYAAFLERVTGMALDPLAVRIQFTRSLPVNGLEEAQTLEKLSGIVDRNALQARAAAIVGKG